MYLSNSEIEAISKRVLRAYAKLPSVRDKPITRIDPDILAKDLLSLSIEYHLLSTHGEILGMTAFGAAKVEIYDTGEPACLLIDETKIFMDYSLLAENANIGRRNFTLTHEAAHQILRMLFPNVFNGTVYSRRVFCYAPLLAARGKRIDWIEIQANSLASYLLLPENLVRSSMRSHGLKDQIEMLNRVFAPVEYNAFSEMARELGVSRTALHIRLSKLGMIKKDYFQRPYDLIDIWPDKDEAYQF